MTAILWKNNALYTDSHIEKNGEWLNISDKALAVNRPCRLNTNSASLISATGEFRERQRIDDWIVGFTYTGASAPARALMRLLTKLTAECFDGPDSRGAASGYTFDRLIERYKQAAELDLHNAENDATVLMVGVKYNYLASFTTDTGFGVIPFDKQRMCALGSGETHIRALDKSSEEAALPIRLMWHAFYMEASCGGTVYRYEVTKNSKRPSGHAFKLTGLWFPPSDAMESCSTILATTDIEPNLTVPTKTPTQTPKRSADTAKRRTRKTNNNTLAKRKQK